MNWNNRKIRLLGLRGPEKPKKTYVSDRMLGPQTSPCQTRFFRFFRFFSVAQNIEMNWNNRKIRLLGLQGPEKPKKPKKPMSQIECWVPRHLPVRLGFFGFFRFFRFFFFFSVFSFFCLFFCCFEFVSFFLLGAFWWIDLMQSDRRVGK